LKAPALLLALEKKITVKAQKNAVPSAANSPR